MASRILAPPEKVAQLKALQARDREYERQKLANVDAFRVLGYEPTCLPRRAAIKAGAEVIPEPCGQCPQELFHAATEDDVLYGGAAGGGKTIGLVMEAVRAAVRYPGIRVLMLRRTYDELAESLYPEFQRIQWAAALGGRWNKTEKEITFPHGSVIRLRYLENLEDASRRQGGAYQLLLVDERTLLPPGVIDVIALERLRSAHGVPVLGIRSTSNPGGPSHGEVKVKYVDPTEHGRKIVTSDHGLTVRFIPAKATDNPYLDEAYFRRLDAIADPARRAAMRDGDWGQFAGQMFCYDYRVEILSADGWKAIPLVERGEFVASLSREGEMTFQPVTNVWQFPYFGDMLVHEGRALDFSVTPGHRMWTHGRNSPANFRFVNVEDLPDASVHLRAAATWNGDPGHDVTVTAPRPVSDFEPLPGMCVICGQTPPDPNRRGRCEACYRAWLRMGRPADLTLVRDRRSNPVENYAQRKEYTFDRGDWCELLGWYLSEGFVSRASSASRYAGRVYGFGIAQAVDPVKIEQIRRLLTQMGFAFTFDSRRFRVASTVLGGYFEQFGHHADKFVPREILTWETGPLRRLFDALMAGDGCMHRAGFDASIYTTTSRQLADDVQEIAVRLNRVASVSRYEGNGRQAPYYRVSVYQTGHDRSVIKKRNIRRERYDGKVACVTVAPYNTVLVRRNGKAMWCGNSEYRWDRHTLDPITLPSGWRRYVGVDWGYAAPWAVVWAAVDEDGRVWFYRELYKTQVGEADQANQILVAEAEDEHVSVRYADDAMWATRGDAKPIADIYAEQGVHLTKAEKTPGSRVAGWQRWHTYLKDGPACPHHRAAGWDTCPMVHIFRTMPKLLHELQNLPHAIRGNPEDADTSAPDHAMDAARYLLLNLGGGPQFVVFEDAAKTLLEAAGIEVLKPAGAFGRRPSDVDDLFRTEEREAEGMRATQRSPFA